MTRRTTKPIRPVSAEFIFGSPIDSGKIALRVNAADEHHVDLPMTELTLVGFLRAGMIGLGHMAQARARREAIRKARRRA